MRPTNPGALPFCASPEAVRHQLPSGELAAWNRFLPSLVLLNEDAQQLLDDLRDPAFVPSAEERAFLRQLQQHHLAYQGEADPSAGSFYEAMERELQAYLAEAGRLLDGEHGYASLGLQSRACNLACAYCALEHLDPAAARDEVARAPGAARQEILLGIVDRFFSRPSPTGRKRISFSGGEFLLRWDLLREVVQHVEARYADVDHDYRLISNATLVTEEIARFLGEHAFFVSVAIDGYRELHDRSRVYHDGRGSYDDVLRAVELLNRHSPHVPIVGFQGTFDDHRSFDPEKLFAMAEHGFLQARMAPNLLGISAQEAVERAHFHAALFHRGQQRGFHVYDDPLQNMLNVLAADAPGFSFFCRGLASTDALAVDVDTLDLNLLCGYATPARVPLSRCGGEIHSPLLLAAAERFLRQRLGALREACAACDVLGVCRGACMMSGLDAQNRINPAACAYQRTFWRRMIELRRA